MIFQNKKKKAVSQSSADRLRAACDTALFQLSILLISDVRGLCGIECKVADACNKTVNSERYYRKEKISERPRGIPLGLEA